MKHREKFPNLIIAGAPKSGTTSLYDWLNAHPEAAGSTVKETRYFIDIDYPLSKNRPNFHESGFGGYKSYFQADTEKLIFEATPDYMYQLTALNEIPKITPKPQVLFLLRNPAIRALSLYKFAAHNMAVLDRNLSFSQFVDHIWNESRAYESNAILNFAIKHGEYVSYIRRWSERMGPENITIRTFENLKADPRSFMTALADELGIEPTFYDTYSFQAENRSYTVRFRGLHRAARTFRKAIGHKMQSELRSLGAHKLYRQLNEGSTDFDLSDADREAVVWLHNYYSSFNKALSKEFHVSIDTWNTDEGAY